ncbi:Hypothetical predicted protein, partial [Pelobates cultripes]
SVQSGQRQITLMLPRTAKRNVSRQRVPSVVHIEASDAVEIHEHMFQTPHNSLTHLLKTSKEEHSNCAEQENIHKTERCSKPEEIQKSSNQVTSCSVENPTDVLDLLKMSMKGTSSYGGDGDES